jgi:hypothetical protein
MTAQSSDNSAEPNQLAWEHRGAKCLVTRLGAGSGTGRIMGYVNIPDPDFAVTARLPTANYQFVWSDDVKSDRFSTIEVLDNKSRSPGRLPGMWHAKVEYAADSDMMLAVLRVTQFVDLALDKVFVSYEYRRDHPEVGS